MKSSEEMLIDKNSVLSEFIALIGFDPEMVAVELASDADNLTCKKLALQGVRPQRDFSNTALSEAGIAASNQWLDTLVRRQPCDIG